MVNTIIKFLGILILIFSIQTPMVNASEESVKQCFYMVSEDQSGKELEEDLRLLDEKGIPIILIINPDSNIKRNSIDVLEKLQKMNKLKVLVKDKKNLKTTYFAVKGYNEKLNLSGRYTVDKTNFNYIGKEQTKFDLIMISEDPVDILSQLNEKTKNKNYALLVKGEYFNISSLLLAYEEIEGEPPNLEDYIYEIEKPALVYRLFIHIGDITIGFFIVSIIIFLGAIVIFRRWSTETFFD